MEETLKTIYEVELETGISAFTIRYYDKCGFFHPIARTRQGRRRFSSADVNRLLLIDALRKSGLSIDGLKNLAPRLDDATCVDDMLKLCSDRIQSIEIQIEELELCRQRLMDFAAKKASEGLHCGASDFEGVVDDEIDE